MNEESEDSVFPSGRDQQVDESRKLPIAVGDLRFEEAFKQAAHGNPGDLSAYVQDLVSRIQNLGMEVDRRWIDRANQLAQSGTLSEAQLLELDQVKNQLYAIDQDVSKAEAAKNLEKLGEFVGASAMAGSIAQIAETYGAKLVGAGQLLNSLGVKNDGKEYIHASESELAENDNRVAYTAYQGYSSALPNLGPSRDAGKSM